MFPASVLFALSAISVLVAHDDARRCDKGQFLVKAKGKCYGCPENSFMDIDNHTHPSCFKCTDYTGLDEVEKTEPCTPDQDTKIVKCGPGLYPNKRGKYFYCFPCAVDACAEKPVCCAFSETAALVPGVSAGQSQKPVSTGNATSLSDEKLRCKVNCVIGRDLDGETTEPKNGSKKGNGHISDHEVADIPEEDGTQLVVILSVSISALLVLLVVGVFLYIFVIKPPHHNYKIAKMIKNNTETDADQDVIELDQF